jgi:hypothetical protein
MLKVIEYILSGLFAASGVLVTSCLILASLADRKLPRDAENFSKPN